MKKLLLVLMFNFFAFANELAYCITEEMNGSSAECYTINVNPKYLTNHVGNMSKDGWELVDVAVTKGMNGVFYKFYFKR